MLARARSAAALSLTEIAESERPATLLGPLGSVAREPSPQRPHGSQPQRTAEPPPARRPRAHRCTVILAAAAAGRSRGHVLARRGRAKVRRGDRPGARSRCEGGAGSWNAGLNKMIVGLVADAYLVEMV